MSAELLIPRPDLTWFSVEGYKAFGQEARVELGKLTLLLGRNNAGKTALCFAPSYLTHPLGKDAPSPLPTKVGGIDFGALPSVCFRRQATGLQWKLGLAGVAGANRLAMGVTSLPEHGHKQVVTHLSIDDGTGRAREFTNITWSAARSALAEVPELASIPPSIHVLRGMRPLGERYHDYLGYTPDDVGQFGERAPMILAASGDKGIDEINDFFAPLRVRLHVRELKDAFETRKDTFEVLAEGTSREPVSMLDSGAGIAQILPLVVAIRLARAQPSLFCLEQPELHLHPRAHVAVAELLIECVKQRPSTRLLVETHSDVLVLRIRREIAAGRLSPRDVKMYFVEDDTAVGGQVKEIAFDERATPDWWPKDVFAEPQREFAALRRELVRRGLLP
ncbi:AAA family ATPase [Polyangium mundeleinium]|uniref:AAA family ATPase n=1 Tax=Polyangium mundeleinium TaxID=2995306 RepID=A0ABT5EQQ5_9BACT|nr:AAA family ATPase [Polyangium mundeleinium]MDC0744165.1 AAA family ATPase [Polyangium mundeleinium]